MILAWILVVVCVVFDALCFWVWLVRPRGGFWDASDPR